MKWPWVSRKRLEEVKDMLAESRVEVHRLIDTIISLKEGGFDPVPWLKDGPWPDGKYVMGDEEPVHQTERIMMAESTVTGTNSVIDDTLAAEIEDDLRRAFPDED